MRAGKGFTLFISTEDRNDIIKIVKSLEYLGVLIDGATATTEHEIKKQESKFLGALLAPLPASLVQPVVSSVVTRICGRGLRRARRGHIDKNF